VIVCIITLPEDWWLEDDPFLLGFSRALLVSGSVELSKIIGIFGIIGIYWDYPS